MWRHVEDKTVTARKPHQCYLCGEVIEAKSTYRRRTGTHDNEGFVTMHMHQDCDEATHEWDWMDWETFSFGELDRPKTDNGTVNGSPDLDFDDAVLQPNQ